MSRIHTLLATLFLAALPAPVVASDGSVFAQSGYWQGFEDFWVGAFKRQNGIVLTVLGVGLVALFIITRAKWKK